MERSIRLKDDLGKSLLDTGFSPSKGEGIDYRRKDNWKKRGEKNRKAALSLQQKWNKNGVEGGSNQNLSLFLKPESNSTLDDPDMYRGQSPDFCPVDPQLPEFKQAIFTDGQINKENQNLHHRTSGPNQHPLKNSPSQIQQWYARNSTANKNPHSQNCPDSNSQTNIIIQQSKLINPKKIAGRNVQANGAENIIRSKFGTGSYGGYVNSSVNVVGNFAGMKKQDRTNLAKNSEIDIRAVTKKVGHKYDRHMEFNNRLSERRGKLGNPDDPSMRGLQWDFQEGAGGFGGGSKDWDHKILYSDWA